MNFERHELRVYVYEAAKRSFGDEVIARRCYFSGRLASR
jgi:hypothetical protein